MPKPNALPFAAVHSHLGPDALLLSELNGKEGLSTLFSFELSLLSKVRELPFAEIVGKDLTVAIEVVGTEKRFLHGMVAGFSQKWIAEADGRGFDYSLYTATLVPRLWMLTRSRGSRIFQDLSVPEIVEQILGERGIDDYRLDLETARYPKREFCVQYRETEYDFLARLLEDEGICFYFEHEEGKHTWVLADGSVAHRACPVQGFARYRAGTGGLREGAVVTDLVMGQQIRSTRYQLRDFDFKQPELDLSAGVDASEPVPPGADTRELYDYPGMHRTMEEEGTQVGDLITLQRGEQLSRVRMEEEDAQVTTLSGTSTARAFSTGFLFTLESQDRAELNGRQYLLTSVQHHLSQPGHHTSGTAPGAQLDPDAPRYQNRFQCIPAGIPFRPARVTRKPTVQGPQTAIVVGPTGTDIHTDNYGRVKVQFHWDREGQKNENSSCWIRVSQVWAGHGWGGMHIPHVGHEVIVDFLEGDPDRPLITGRVYHAGNPVPETLPENKRKSIIRDNFGNELILDATPDKEEVRLHSPNQESTLAVGWQGWGGFTQKDHFEAHGGNMVELGFGNKYEAFAGNVVEGTVGFSTDVKIGWLTEALLGGKFSYLLGVDAGYHLGPEIKLHRGATASAADNDIATFAKEHNIVCAGKKANLVGGAGAGPGKATSIVEADSRWISMSIGPNLDPAGVGLSPAQARSALLLSLAIGATGALAGVPVATALTELLPGDIGKGVGLGGTLALEAALLIVETAALWGMLEAWHKQVKPVSHRDSPGDEVDAIVSLEKGGCIDIYGKEQVTLGVEKNVLGRLGAPLPGGGRAPALPAKGAELDVGLKTIRLSGPPILNRKSELTVGTTGIAIDTPNKFKVVAKGGISLDSGRAPFTANKNLTVLP